MNLYLNCYFSNLYPRRVSRIVDLCDEKTADTCRREFKRSRSRLVVGSASLNMRNSVPRVAFTSHLKRHLDCPTQDVTGCTLAEALENVFAENPRLRSYILDDQGRLRQHVVIFIDDQVVQDRPKLSDTVLPTSEIYVMQALSGG